MKGIDQQTNNSIKNLIVEVCREYYVLLSDITEPCRLTDVVNARKMIAYLLKEKSKFNKENKCGNHLTLKQIGSYLGEKPKNHSTIKYYLAECKYHIETEESTKEIYNRLKNKTLWKELLCGLNTQNLKV